MRINVAELRRHPGQSESFSFSEELGPLTIGAEEIEILGPVQVEGRVVSGQRVLTVAGKVEATVRRQCSRCLAPVEERTVAELEEEFIHSSQALSLDEETREEVRVFTGEEIDLRDAVEEALILALPMKVLCRPDCQGLCPRCGRELEEGPCECPEEEIDERWAEFRKLLGNGWGGGNNGGS